MNFCRIQSSHFLGVSISFVDIFHAEKKCKRQTRRDDDDDDDDGDDYDDSRIGERPRDGKKEKEKKNKEKKRIESRAKEDDKGLGFYKWFKIVGLYSCVHGRTPTTPWIETE